MRVLYVNSMPGVRWTKNYLNEVVKRSYSFRQVIKRLGLRPAGGNYATIKRVINDFGLDISHFKGKAWNKGLKTGPSPRTPLKDILIRNSNFQSHKLKNRLFVRGIKKQECEICGWSKMSTDGRIPLELDHINGDRRDNRLGNLRILCPNCHSLQPTHRGRNIKNARVVERYTRST